MVKEKTAILFGGGLKGKRVPVIELCGTLVIPHIEETIPLFGSLGLEPIPLQVKIYFRAGLPIDEKEAYYYYQRTDSL